MSAVAAIIVVAMYGAVAVYAVTRSDGGTRVVVADVLLTFAVASLALLLAIGAVALLSAVDHHLGRLS